MDDKYILAAVFTCVLLVVFTIANIIVRRREVILNIEAVNLDGSDGTDKTDERIDQIISSDNEFVRHYFHVARTKSIDSLEFRLIRAGFLSKGALRTYHIVRFITSFGVFALSWFLFDLYFPSLTPMMIFLISGIISGVGFILNSAALDHLAKKKQILYRKLFPDFMDLIIVCVDAGLSLEAGLERVTQDFMSTNPDFGSHLGIMGLEIRAGKPIRDALRNFADRINVDEARSLATLFKQSEELGSSVGKTLRTFSREMRQTRLVRAEEKANALPIKMLFPMALFLFPVNLIIVLVPIMLSIAKSFKGLVPPS